MKKLLLISVLGLVVSAQAFSAGTEIKDSTISNTAVIKDSGNHAYDDSEANMGSIKVQKGDLSIKDSEVLNDANVKNSHNHSEDKAKANMGSVDISN